jgi:uncharacterized protein
MNPETSQKLDRLKAILRETGGCAVAFSGGVDSSLLLTVAHEVLGGRCLAVIARAPIYPEGEQETALELVRARGIPCEVVEFDALSLEAFRHNPPDRCYHCKKAVFGRLVEVARAHELPVVADGTNASDLADYRPGRRALEELAVRSPLKEAGLTKDEIRTISREVYDLPTAGHPSMACLATRVPYGSEITIEKVHQIAAIEAVLRRRGFSNYRARHHGDLVRIELPPHETPRALEVPLRDEILRAAREAGFRYVTLDLRGYRTGSMNEALSDTPGAAESA